MEHAVETGNVDPKQLILACAGRIACTFAATAIQKIIAEAQKKINTRIQRSNAVHAFAFQAQLDVPTSERPDIMQISHALSFSEFTGVTALWGAVHEVFSIFSSGVRLSGQCVVLLSLLRGQRRAMLVAMLPLVPQLFSVVNKLGVITNRLQDGKSCTVHVDILDSLFEQHGF